MYYIGIDLGTSSVKLLVMDAKGEIVYRCSREYPLYFPKQGYAEQNPQDWWEAVFNGLQEIVAHVDPQMIRGISFGGQMHGLVMLDESDQVIRPAILWNDGRAKEESEYLNEVIGKGTLARYCANISFAGFTAPKLLWVKKHELENFNRTKKLMLPKDYLAYRLSGVFSTDVSDASGTLLFDVQHKCWSKEMMMLCDIQESQLPAIYESYEETGTILPEIAKALGLPKDVKIVAGAGDNAAAAIGTGTCGEGGCTISLGTSGTIFISSDSFRLDKHNALHSFAHSDGTYHLMGCMLSAASCNKWWMEDILQTKEYQKEQADITNLGENSIYFLPYLMGERSPHNDANARGAFIGMSMDSSRSDMTQAILEGVAFALRDSLEVAKNLGIQIATSKICGGGANSPLWKVILANVLNIEIEEVEIEEGPGYGAAMLASVACHEFVSVREASKQLAHVVNVIKPQAELVAKYECKYQNFRTLYPALKASFLQCKEEESSW